MKRRENILRLDSFGLIPEVKGLRLLDAGFFYQMTKLIENRTANVEIDEEGQYFRPLTPESISHQLEQMRQRWFASEVREFDIEDHFEEWMMRRLIAAIDNGGLTL